MKRLFVIFVIACLMMAGLSAARKALVIGNASYDERPLRNPVNDANDVSAALEKAGFKVNKHTNLNKEGMDQAITAFVSSLTPQDEVLFYYSGHGVQIDGVNYLIPVRETINSVARCQYLAYNGNMLMDELKTAAVSIVILDACRDNPFTYTKSLSKGLASMKGAAGSQYIIFATEEGKTADDGTGRNSPFAESFIQNVSNSNKKIEDMMKDITNDVAVKTGERQIPWTSGNLRQDFYFNLAAASQPEEKKATAPSVKVETTVPTGTIELQSEIAGDIYLDGKYTCSIGKGKIKTLKDMAIGSHRIELKYSGKSLSQYIYVSQDQTSSHKFISVQVPADMVFVEGGSFRMGSKDGERHEKPVHRVNVSDFMIGKYEVTQKEWKDMMGSNPSYFKGDNLPVECVSWYDAVEYCNKLSIKVGLTPCYTINKNITDPNNTNREEILKWLVTIDWNANGYRLPTEAEWEYAARGGNKSKGYKYSGSDNPGSVAWYNDNSGDKTHSVGSKQANELGLYDMSGNVEEWCWDWYDEKYYSNSQLSDPRGPESGAHRLLRGDYWGFFTDSSSVYCRYYDNPDNRYFYGFGFRVARSIK